MFKKLLHHQFMILLLIFTILGCSKGEVSIPGNDVQGLPVTSTPETRVEFWLGTTISLTIYHDVDDAVFRRLFDRLQVIEGEMSLQIAGSLMNKVNANAGVAPVQVSMDMIRVVQSALEIAEKSNGAFDPTIGPLVRAWDIGGNPRVPGKEEIDSLKALINWKKLLVDAEAQTLYLTEPGMALDLGAIAKGFAADELVVLARSMGISSALFDLGGNIIVVGSKPDGSSWRIGVQNPYANRGKPIGIVGIQDATMVSSGTYERFFEANGIKYHHILDPFTGFPSNNDIEQVTMVSNASSMLCDALSTACFVLGLEKAKELIQSMEGYEAVFVTKDKKVHLSSGLENIYRVADVDFPIYQK